MKKRTIAISFLSLVLILSSCQKIKDVFTVKVDADFSVALPVVIQEPLLKSTTVAFLATETMDPLSDDALADYKEKIKGFELTGMTGTINPISADVTLTNATLKISTATNSAEWNFTDLQLTNGTIVTFSNDDDQFTKVDAILNEQIPVTVTFSGNASQTNVTFTLTVKFITVVTAKII